MKKVLKVLGITLAILVLIVVVLGLIAPKEFGVERSITINAPQSSVANQMFHFSNFHNWSPWQDMDPNMQSEVIGEDGKEGAVYQWKGNDNVGSGEMKNKFTSNNEMEYEMHFKEPFENEADGYWRVEDAGSGHTKAIWGFKSPASFPMNGIMMVMGMEKMLAKDFDKGLNKLKAYTEANPMQEAQKVDTTSIAAPVDTAK